MFVFFRLLFFVYQRLVIVFLQVGARVECEHGFAHRPGSFQILSPCVIVDRVDCTQGKFQVTGSSTEGFTEGRGEAYPDSPCCQSLTMLYFEYCTKGSFITNEHRTHKGM